MSRDRDLAAADVLGTGTGQQRVRSEQEEPVPPTKIVNTVAFSRRTRAAAPEHRAHADHHHERDAGALALEVAVREIAGEDDTGQAAVPLNATE